MRRMRRVVVGRRLSIVGCLVVLSGCHFAPAHERPPLPTPAVYPVAPAGVVAAVRPVDVGWRAFFRDPRLQALIATALQHNRDLAVAVARIDVARGLYRIRNADRIPTANA